MKNVNAHNVRHLCLTDTSGNLIKEENDTHWLMDM